MRGRLLLVMVLAVLASCGGPVRHEEYAEVGGSKILVAVWYENRDGTKHGPIKKWHLNHEILLEGRMVDGKPDGIWTTYYGKDRPRIQIAWDQGKFLGSVTWWTKDGEQNILEFEKDLKQEVWHAQVQHAFPSDFDLALESGRSFHPSLDDSGNVVVNEAMAKSLPGPVLGGRVGEKVVIGVAENFFQDTDRFFWTSPRMVFHPVETAHDN